VLNREQSCVLEWLTIRSEQTVNDAAGEFLLRRSLKVREKWREALVGFQSVNSLDDVTLWVIDGFEDMSMDRVDALVH